MPTAAPAYPHRFGPYVLLEPLGTGGMGRVALALTGELGMETLCVIKRLLPHLRKDPELVARFRDEANLARRLSHGNLVATHAVGQIEGEPFIAQEFVEGHDLADVRSRCSIERIPFPLDVGLHIVGQLARGLAYAHDFESLELVHRDINPVNIRLSFSGEVKLLDFGLARSKLKTVMTEPGHGLWGKLTYMAPEQISEGVVDRRADLYALGIVLWELLTRRPFGTTIEDGKVVLPNETRQQAIDRVLRDAVLPPSRINPEVSPALDAVALRAVARDPNDRFQTAADLRAALGKFLPSTPIPEEVLAKLMARLYNVDAERESRQELVLAASELQGQSPRASVPPLGDKISPPGDPPSSDRAGAILDVEATWLRTEPASPDDLYEAHEDAHPRRWGLAVILASAAIIAVVFLGLRSRDQRHRVVARPSAPIAAGPLAAPPPMVVALPAATVAEPGATSAVVVPEPNPGSSVGTAPEPNNPIDRSPRRARPAPAPRRASPPAGGPTAAALLEAAETAFERKSFPEAIRLGRQAVEAGGGSPAHVLLGNAYFLSDKMRDAEREYEQALRADPSDTLVRSRLAAARERLQPGAGP